MLFVFFNVAVLHVTFGVSVNSLGFFLFAMIFADPVTVPLWREFCMEKISSSLRLFLF